METINVKQPPFQIHFKNLNEIRMGSPYNGCDIEFVGSDKIKLPKATWQDKYAWSSDFKTLVLVKWDLDNNIAGFRFFISNSESGEGYESYRILGLLNNLSIIESKIKFNKFLFDKKKNDQGLSCNVDEEYNISH